MQIIKPDQPFKIAVKVLTKKALTLTTVLDTMQIEYRTEFISPVVTEIIAECKDLKQGYFLYQILIM